MMIIIIIMPSYDEGHTFEWHALLSHTRNSAFIFCRLAVHNPDHYAREQRFSQLLCTSSRRTHTVDVHQIVIEAWYLFVSAALADRYKHRFSSQSATSPLIRVCRYRHTVCVKQINYSKKTTTADYLLETARNWVLSEIAWFIINQQLLCRYIRTNVEFHIFRRNKIGSFTSKLELARCPQSAFSVCIQAKIS